jgi:hypothetical protein
MRLVVPNGKIRIDVSLVSFTVDILPSCFETKMSPTSISVTLLLFFIRQCNDVVRIVGSKKSFSLSFVGLVMRMFVLSLFRTLSIRNELTVSNLEKLSLWKQKV